MPGLLFLNLENGSLFIKKGEIKEIRKDIAKSGASFLEQCCPAAVMPVPLQTWIGMEPITFSWFTERPYKETIPSRQCLTLQRASYSTLWDCSYA